MVVENTGATNPENNESGHLILEYTRKREYIQNSISLVKKVMSNTSKTANTENKNVRCKKRIDQLMVALSHIEKALKYLES